MLHGGYGETVRIITPDGRKTFLPCAAAAGELAEYAVLCARIYGSSMESCGPTMWNEDPRLNSILAGDPAADGLVIRVWQREAPSEVVIVFRGTTSARDWMSNLNWLMARRFPRLFTDKYTQLAVLLPKLIGAIEDRYPHHDVLTAGHSLGGGLAQYCAYLSERISRVYAFDSSPVTGFFAVPRAKRRERTKVVDIRRINERGEALAYVRGPIRFLRRFFRKRRSVVRITDYRFNFDRRSGIALILTWPFRTMAQHGMERLATSLSLVARTTEKS